MNIKGGIRDKSAAKVPQEPREPKEEEVEASRPSGYADAVNRVRMANHEKQRKKDILDKYQYIS